MSNRIRTSLHLSSELWREFQVWVVSRYGGRKLSDHVEIALREYLEKHGSEETNTDIDNPKLRKLVDEGTIIRRRKS